MLAGTGRLDDLKRAMEGVALSRREDEEPATESFQSTSAIERGPPSG